MKLDCYDAQLLAPLALLFLIILSANRNPAEDVIDMRECCRILLVIPSTSFEWRAAKKIENNCVRIANSQ